MAGSGSLSRYENPKRPALRGRLLFACGLALHRRFGRVRLWRRGCHGRNRQLRVEPAAVSLKREQLLPMATLLALTTIIPELFTGSTPPVGFLNPGLLLFLFLGYGVAVLLIRELVIRWHCGILGLFFLGLAYSIFNEGLLAKTLILEKGLPVPSYDNYGYVLGISFPWAAGIGTWHACASVMFPIVLTHHFFPNGRDEPWLNGKVALISGGLLILLGCAVFLGNSQKGIKGTFSQLAVLLAIMLVGFALASRCKGEVLPGAASSPVRPLLLGLSVLLPFWGVAFLASARVPLVVFFLALVSIILGYAWVLKRRRWLAPPGLLFFAVGWYLHNAVQAAVITGGPGRDPMRAFLTAALDGVILLLLFRQIRRCAGKVNGPVAMN